MRVNMKGVIKWLLRDRTVRYEDMTCDTEDDRCWETLDRLLNLLQEGYIEKIIIEKAKS